MDSKQITKKTDTQLAKMLADENARDIAVKALLEAAQNADQRFWDKKANSGRGDWMIEPDHSTRARAAEILLAYTDGRPIERKEVISRTVDSVDDMMKRAKASPALRDSLLNLLNDMQALPVGDVHKTG